jgi:hypothetical protein
VTRSDLDISTSAAMRRANREQRQCAGEYHRLCHP